MTSPAASRTESRRPGLDLFRASAGQRVLGILALVALLWLGVWWAL
ncbi:MAG: hypothetical protein KIT43_11865 [Bauldia sp.]|nr:hypothetical protein [Bauldia sp.]MCW5716550.1 hypothetical protein [Bauldia sp.]